MIEEDQLEFTVIVYPTGIRFGAVYNACVVSTKNSLAEDINTANLTGRGDTPLTAIVNLFNQVSQQLEQG